MAKGFRSPSYHARVNRAVFTAHFGRGRARAVNQINRTAGAPTRRVGANPDPNAPSAFNAFQ